MVIKFLKASQGDCFLISYHDNKSITRNILIDGGVLETYFDNQRNDDGMLKIEIDAIREMKQNIDLLILTHIDNDHIGGLLQWFQKDLRAHELISNVWFNSGSLISEHLSEMHNSDLKISLEKHNTPETSVKEGLDFEEYLLSKKIWNRTLIKDGVCDNVFGAEIEVLSPNEMQLKKLLREYVKNENSYTASANKDWDKDITDLIEQDEELPVDRSPTNQSSIAFILTVEGKKFLFLGDASSDQITSKLSSLGYSKNNPISVECLKISHHGSKNNTSNELLDIINTDQYFISTDGSRHSHPNKITLARILKRNPKAAIHFNYEHIKDAIFNDHDFDNFQLMKVYHSIELEF